MSVKKAIVVRVRLAFLAVVIFAILIIIKIGKIQFVDGEKWIEKSNNMSLQYRSIKATRGNIYADDGSLLATSLPFFKVALDPTVPSEELFDDGIDSLSMMLAQFYGDHNHEYFKRKIINAREAGKRYLILNSEQINYHDKKLMAKWPIFREGRYKGGVIFEKVDKRFKPFSYLASRTIGFINDQMKGAGLEYSFNEQLSGVDGEGLFQKASGGIWMPVLNGEQIEPVNGYDIQTTIDINLQDVAEHALLKALKKHDAEYGSVILMEVKTGEIKAIANLGKSKRTGNYYELYNYAVGAQGLTEPGSTFKLASMIALLEEDRIDLRLTDTINTFNGRHKFYDRVMTDARNGGYGVLTVQQVFEKSSNIGVSRLVDKYFRNNPQRFIDYLYDMGISDSLNFQIKGEAKPFIKTPDDKSWSGISLPWISIGYELKLAPIHTLSLYNAVANNGKMIKPILIKETRLADNVVENYKTEVINEKICSEKTLKKLRKMLEGVVEHGTAKNIKTDKYKIAGKTGTSQKIKNGRYVKDYYTSFVGYFPAKRPKYSCIVVVDSPKGWIREGSVMAAPVFKEIADKVYSRDLSLHEPTKLKRKSEIGVFPEIKAGYKDDLMSICNAFGISNHSNTNDEFVRTSVKDNSIYWNSKKIQDALVPNVVGLKLKDALYVLENAGMKVKFKGQGRIVKQSQRPGIEVLRGSEIELKLE